MKSGVECFKHISKNSLISHLAKLMVMYKIASRSMFCLHSKFGRVISLLHKMDSRGSQEKNITAKGGRV